VRHIGTAKPISAGFACGGFFYLLQVSSTTRLAALGNAGSHLGYGGIQGHKSLIQLKDGL
jgi:hypothetical protein